MIQLHTVTTMVSGILPFVAFVGIPLAFLYGHAVIDFIRYAVSSRRERKSAEIEAAISAENERTVSQIHNEELLKAGDRVLSLDEQRNLTG